MASPIQEAVNRAMLDGMGRYNVGPTNLERVVNLVTADVLQAIRPEVEKRVRLMYMGLAR